MNTNQIIVILGLISAIAAALAPDAFGQYALVLVALGLINGFMNPMADMAARMAYTIAAVAMPAVANNLDVIPMVGAPINAIIDNIMVMVAGMVVANFLMALKDQVMPSGN